MSDRRTPAVIATVLAALAAGSATAAAATPLQPVRAGVHPAIGLLLPNLAASNPSPGVFRITNTGIFPSGSFVVAIHRVGVKAGSSFVVPSLGHGQSFSRSLGSVCEGVPPVFGIVADAPNLIHESNEADNAVLVQAAHNC
jgi:hypothetical protein